MRHTSVVCFAPVVCFFFKVIQVSAHSPLYLRDALPRVVRGQADSAATAHRGDHEIKKAPALVPVCGRPH